MRLFAVTLAGLVLGIGASLGDDLGYVSATPVVRVVGIVLNAGSIWAGSAIVAGSWFGRPRSSAAGASLVLLAAVVGYYSYGVLLGDRAVVGLAGVSDVLRSWLVAAIVLGPALGLLGWTARRLDALGLLARLTPPLAVALEVLVRFRPGAASFEYDPVWAWTVYGLLAIAVGAGAVVTMRWVSGPPRNPALATGDRQWR